MRYFLFTAVKRTFNKVVKFSRSFYVSMLKFSNRSDYTRWSKKSSLFESWDERTKILASNILPKATVFEFGAARLVLKRYIPQDCTYLHSDIVARDNETIVIDLNRNLPDLPKSNYVVFSGVLEYVNDVEKVLKHCSKFTEEILFSYAVLDNYSNVDTRRYNGWVSDLSKKQLDVIATNINWELRFIENWKGQLLFSLKK